MKKQTFYIVLLIITITISFGIRFMLLESAKPPSYVFTYAENQSDDYPTTMGAKKFSELVWEKTNGRIKILVKANAQLGSEKEVISQMQYGGIDFARISIAQISNSIPKMNVLQMPYLYNNSEHLWKVLNGSIGDEFLALVEAQHLKGLSWYDAGARSLYTFGKPITTPADISGLKIRVQESDLMNDIISELGAYPYNTSYADVYSVLERKIIDGAENNLPSYVSSGHYKVAGYYTVDEHIRIPEMQLCSEYTWNKLSAQDQQIILECARESAIYERMLWDETEAKARQIAQEHGCVIIELSHGEKQAFKDGLSGIYEKYCSEYSDIIDQIIELGKN